MAIGLMMTESGAQAKQAAPVAGTKSAGTYYVDCESGASRSEGSLRNPLKSLAEVNALPLQPGDRIALKRGTVCHGALRPQGSGVEGLPIRLEAYGEGDLPRVEADSPDEAALELHDQAFWEISQLDFKGGSVYGIFIKSDTKILHHLYLRDLRVHDVRGTLSRKASGLVVITAASDEPTVGLDDVQIDGVMASRTTQWSGIFVERATHVQISNSMVHDVQGDGIVVFRAKNVVIQQSVAWHTGMQDRESIGTPNAIWTWSCTDCRVSENEAFLTDSPGIDGGSFDIDFANTRNTVQGNFGHDTAGYCVSVFAAFGPTVDSVVADNLCLRNGMSPRLAQRQGALLLMTWQGGTLDRVDIHGNRVGWDPPGQTPLLQIGSDLKAERVLVRDNELESSGTSFINPRLKYSGGHNRFVVTSASFSKAHHEARGWLLTLTATPGAGGKDSDGFRAAVVAIKSAALQFGPLGLQVSVIADPERLALAADLIGADTGISLRPLRGHRSEGLHIALRSPSGKVSRAWQKCPGPADLGWTLWHNLGHPDFSRLGLEDVPALP
jgi:hypothetical protein